MKSLRLHLWREWREHRTTLAMLACTLPLLAFAISHGLARKTQAIALVQDAVPLGFVLIMLVAVGGELLGTDRRGGGLRWLERLPSGLGVPFCSKIVMLIGTTLFAAALGVGTIRAITFLRSLETRPGDVDWLRWTPAILALVLWTFACSAWALRGGVALLSAATVLGLAWVPLIHVITEGFRPSNAQIDAGLVLAGVCALAAAWSAYVRGGRLGRGTGWPTLLVLVQALPMLGLSSYWAVGAIRERERLDPLVNDFRIDGCEVTQDGRAAFLVGHHWGGNWESAALPGFFLRVELDDGSWQRIGKHYVDAEMRLAGDPLERLRPARLVLYTDDREQGSVFDLANGERSTVDPDAHRELNWVPRGLGQEIMRGRGKPSVIRDPFRRRDYLASEVPFRDVLVRPGRWLCGDGSDEAWFLFDPDEGVSEPLDWSPGSAVVFILQDGAVVLQPPEGGLLQIDPETGSTRVIDVDTATGFVPSFGGLGSFWSVRGRPQEPVLLESAWGKGAWNVLDVERGLVRHLPFAYVREEFVGVLGENAVLGIGDAHYLFRLDTTTGEREVLFPRATSD